MFIDGFGISSYRSFGEEIQLIGPCNKINFFIGQNNSGKSNILSFLEKHYHKALQSARVTNVGFKFEELDRHLGNNTGRIKLAFGLKPSSYLQEKIFKNRKLTSESNRVLSLVEKLLQFPELNLRTETVWFVYEANSSQALKLSPDLIESIATHRSTDNRRPSEKLQFQDWNSLSHSLAGRTYRVHGHDMVKSAIPDILGALSPVQLDVPSVTLIQAVREIKSDESVQDYSFNGLNIINELAKLERPDIDENYVEKKNKFEKINRFVRDVIGKDDVQLEVPTSRKTIQIELDGKTLPLENLGTGIHEVIILAIAATLLEEQIICIEEPEIHLHPILQKKLISFLDHHTSNQYFITTHSASMIDIPGAAIFHVQNDGEKSVVTTALSPSDRFAICTDLGYRASDLLQSNCIIWVEGPSDRIYLKHWLKAYDPALEEGLHYTIMFYGGRLLSHLSCDDDEVNEFIALRRINRNLAILIDSDRDKKGLPMNETKRRVRDEFNQGSGFAWITAGREIENYVPVDLMEKIIKEIYPNAVKLASTDQYEHRFHYIDQNGEVQSKNIDKVKIAKRVVETEASLNELDLSKNIRTTADFIRQCNDMLIQ